MSYSIGHRHSLDLGLLWLWFRLAAASPIRPLAWEPLYAAGTALKKQKKKKEEKKSHQATFLWPSDELIVEGRSEVVPTCWAVKSSFSCLLPE